MNITITGTLPVTQWLTDFKKLEKSKGGRCLGDNGKTMGVWFAEICPHCDAENEWGMTGAIPPAIECKVCKKAFRLRL